MKRRLVAVAVSDPETSVAVPSSMVGLARLTTMVSAGLSTRSSLVAVPTCASVLGPPGLKVSVLVPES